MAQNIMDKQKKWLLRQFHTLCGRLHLSAEEKAAIIEGYGVESSAAIACRATRYENFNKIPAERLRNLYNTFLNKQKDSKTIDELVSMAIYSQSASRQTAC